MSNAVPFIALPLAVVLATLVLVGTLVAVTLFMSWTSTLPTTIKTAVMPFLPLAGAALLAFVTVARMARRKAAANRDSSV